MFIGVEQVYGTEWDVVKSTHFIIYHQQVPSDDINRLSYKAEFYYRNIADYLGFKRLNFWTWENRCKIFLYSNRKIYLKETGCSSWSRAHVQVVKKEIKTYIGRKDFFNTILPHEMGHIIFREFVGYNKKLPLWIDEGVACMQEEGSYKRLKAMQSFAKQNKYLKISELSNINNYKLNDMDLFYSQSASIIDFLLNRFGRNKFVDFCRQLRDKENWEEALKTTYGFGSLEELEKDWIGKLLD